MLTIEMIQLMFSAISQSFMFAQSFAFNQEIVDGGTKNRIWSFMSTMGLMYVAFLPLAQLFPTADLSIYQYPAIALAGVIQYVASIAHQNQMAINENEPDKIQTLPFDLHENKFIMQLALFLGPHMAKGLLAFFMGSLVACIFLGAPVYAYSALGLYAVNLLNQYGYLPEFLRSPYLYLNTIITVLAIFGVTSWIGATISIGMVAFTAYDYIRCYLFAADSPTAQFPMADPEKKLTLKPIDEDDPHATEQLDFIIKKHVRHKESMGIHVTFDHFYQSKHITDAILARARSSNF